jgi:hypothetical protein
MSGEKTMGIRKILAAIACIGLVAAPTAAGADELAPDVRSALDRLDAVWGGRPVFRQPLFEIALRAPASPVSWIVTPQAGAASAVAACDRDCNSLTLTVTDEYDGTVVARSNLGDGTALATWWPALGRSYRVRATVETCTTPQCYIAVTVAQ